MEKSKKSRAWRTRLLIYPRFQLTLLTLNLAIFAASSLAVALLVGRSYSYLKHEGIAASLSPDHAYFKFLDYQTTTVYGYLGGAFVIGFLISMFVTLYMSNKLAGPIVRLHIYFDQIIKGQKPLAVFFRKGDFFRDLPPLINQAIDKIQSDSSAENKDVKSDFKKVA